MDVGLSKMCAGWCIHALGHRSNSLTTFRLTRTFGCKSSPCCSGRGAGRTSAATWSSTSSLLAKTSLSLAQASQARASPISAAQTAYIGVCAKSSACRLPSACLTRNTSTATRSPSSPLLTNSGQADSTR
eukprot:20686_1